MNDLLGQHRDGDGLNKSHTAVLCCCMRCMLHAVTHNTHCCIPESEVVPEYVEARVPLKQAGQVLNQTVHSLCACMWVYGCVCVCTFRGQDVRQWHGRRAGWCLPRCSNTPECGCYSDRHEGACGHCCFTWVRV